MRVHAQWHIKGSKH